MLIISFSVIKNIKKKIRKKLILRKIDRIPYVAFKLSIHCIECHGCCPVSISLLVAAVSKTNIYQLLVSKQAHSVFLSLILHKNTCQDQLTVEYTEITLLTTDEFK